MAYLATRSIAFGTYSRPRQARRRPVRFPGHYGLGQTTEAESFCQSQSLRIPPILRAKWLQACITAYQQQHPAAAAAPAPTAAPPLHTPAPIAQPIVTAVAPTGTYAGTPVPIGFSTSQIFVDSNGHQWMYQNTSGTWLDATAAAQSAATASEQAQAAQIAAATATSPQGGPAPILVTSPTISPSLPQQGGAISPVSVSVSSGSSYADVLNWLGERTLLSFAPNWAVLAGVGLIALKLSGKGKFL